MLYSNTAWTLEATWASVHRNTQIMKFDLHVGKVLASHNALSGETD